MGDLTKLLNPGGSIKPPMTSPDLAGGLPAQDRADEEILVQGDDWKPKKTTFLGNLIDGWLMARGHKAAFGPAKEQANIKDALANYQSDPEQAINRLMRIRGKQQLGLELLNQHQDNENQRLSQERMGRSLDMRNDDYIYNQVAGMMGAATEETWPQMRELAIKRANARGVDVTQYIPEQFDPTSVEFIRYGAIKPKDQVAIQQRDRSLDQGDTKIENTEDYRERRLDQIDTAEAGRNARDANNGPRGSNKPKSRKERYGNRAIRSPDGKRVYEFDETGTLMKQTTSDGKVRFFRMGVDGKPIYVRDGK